MRTAILPLLLFAAPVWAEVLFVTHTPPVDPYEDYVPLYVNDLTGDDSRSKAQARNESTPWATIGRAVWGSTTKASPNPAQAASAGDIVKIAPGTYSTNQTTGERYDVIYNPANNGTPGNEIVFHAVGTVTLQHTGTGNDGLPLIGANGRDYIIWDGFTIDETNADLRADSGLVALRQAENITIRNMDLTLVDDAVNDNHSGIRLGFGLDESVEFTDNVLIEDNTIRGSESASNNRNGSAILTYFARTLTIQHNHISDSSGGVFIKGENRGPVTIKWNVITDTNLGIDIGGNTTNEGDQNGRTEVYGNVIHNGRANSYALGIISYNAASPVNVDFYNNTVDDYASGFSYKPDLYNGYSSINIRNNIFAHGTAGHYGVDAEAWNAAFVADYNNFWSGTYIAQEGGTNHVTLAGWQSSSNDDLNSKDTDPDFVDRANNDYRLGPASTVLNDSPDDLDVNENGGTGELINKGAFVDGGRTPGPR